MLDTLGERIHDNRMLRLIGQMLQAGYLEDWVWNATLSGVPQGGLFPRACPTSTWTAGQVCRHNAVAGIHPRGAQGREP